MNHDSNSQKGSGAVEWNQSWASTEGTQEFLHRSQKGQCLLHVNRIQDIVFLQLPVSSPEDRFKLAVLVSAVRYPHAAVRMGIACECLPKFGTSSLAHQGWTRLDDLRMSPCANGKATISSVSADASMRCCAPSRVVTAHLIRHSSNAVRQPPRSRSYRT